MEKSQTLLSCGNTVRFLRKASNLIAATQSPPLILDL